MLIINYQRNEEAAEELARRAREFGVRALPLRADISDVDQAASLVDTDLRVMDPATSTPAKRNR